MKRRIIAAISAILLAGVGAVLLMAYVGNADQRAMAGMETTNVLVVSAPVAEGTASEELTEMVTPTTLPARAVVSGSVSSLDDISGQVATADLQAGEQLLATRFADPASLEDEAEVEIPEDMHQVTVALDSQRVLGGHLTPGDTVGVFISLGDPAQTHLVLHKVLVTEVQGGITVPAESEQEGDPPEITEPETTEAPSGGVMVTLAMDAPDAEQAVFGMEHGTVWLSLEPTDTPEDGTRVVTGENVYE